MRIQAGASSQEGTGWLEGLQMRKKSLCDETDVALLKGRSAAKRVLGGQNWPG